MAKIKIHDEVVTPDGKIGVVIDRFFKGKQALYKVSVKHTGVRVSYSEIFDFKRGELQKRNPVVKSVPLPKLGVAK